MFVDARSVGEGSDVDCDLCIVGAGPAGIAIADRLRASGLSIVMLESGGFESSIATQRLSQGQNVGRRYFSLDTCRPRVFGGGTTVWGGWCRPFDASDFEPNEWTPWSGWPIGESALLPYYSDVVTLCQLGDGAFDAAARQRSASAIPLEAASFENVLVGFSPTKFGDVYRDEIRSRRDVTVFLHANLTAIDLAEGSSRVETLKVSTLVGRSFRVRPRAVVLAAGAIENARLLLASRSSRSEGVGNEFGLVGRFFMEHLHVAAGHVVAPPGAPPWDFYARSIRDGVDARGLLVPSASAQKRHRLLPVSIAIEPASYAMWPQQLRLPSPLTAAAIRKYRQLKSGPLKAVFDALQTNASRVMELPQRHRTGRAAREAAGHAILRAGSPSIYSLYFRAGQIPDPTSRVELSSRRDALGMPQARLRWRVNPADLASIGGWLDVLRRDLSERNVGQVVDPAEGWEDSIAGGPHHMGTTRMAAAAQLGVVDEHCRVHSVENLYVAGSSVFATSGHANPTFTLLALALRLADTIKVRLGHESRIHSRA